MMSKFRIISINYLVSVHVAKHICAMIFAVKVFAGIDGLSRLVSCLQNKEYFECRINFCLYFGIIN